MAGRTSVEFDPERFGEYDAVLICTDHDEVDYAAIARSCDLVIDTRNVMRGLSLEGLVRA
jgi:UDP-N-acetyl-D-glucosamine dehydrogenase